MPRMAAAKTANAIGNAAQDAAIGQTPAAPEETEKTDKTATVEHSLPVNFLGALSEELRTPLNLIIAYSKMVKDGLLGTIRPEQEKALQLVIKNSYWVLMMMNGLLQSSGVPEKTAPLPNADVLVSELFPSPDVEYEISA